MRTEHWSSASLSILLLMSLVTPLSISLLVSTVEASPDTIFSDDFSTATNSDARYNNWWPETGWRMLSSTTGGPKQGAGRLGLLESGSYYNPWIKTPSFATTGYGSIKISFVWTLELNNTRTGTFVAQWSTDNSTWENIAGTTWTPDTDGSPKIIDNLSVSSDGNVGNKPALWIRWYNTKNPGSGSRDKVSFDDVVITGTPSGGMGVYVSISPSENSALPETTLTYTVTVKNIGENTDNYTLTVSDNILPSWDPTIDNENFYNVGPGDNVQTTLRVTIPENAEDGAEDLITVTATSIENENIKDNGTCKAICYVVPPPTHYKEYPTDDQAVMENRGNLSENYPFKLPCGRYHENDCPQERSFLKFDISSIPSGATIENAYLGLYHHFGVFTEGRWMWVEVWTIENDNWTENEIDWNNQPPKVENLYHEYIDYTSYSPDPWLGTIHGWPGVPVKSYIENEIADGAASFVLYSPQENVDPSENTDVDFTATDDNEYPEQWPYLEVWYYENAPQVLVSMSISPGSQAGWPGDNLEYTVTVKNRGTINDNYDLEVSDNAIPSWGPTLSDNPLNNVPPGENRTVTLRVTIPENEELATLDKITVTATSQADNRVSDSAEAIATGPGVWIVASYSPYIEDYAVAVIGAGENIYIANSDPDRFMCYNSVDDTWQNLPVPSGLLWQPGKPDSMIGAFKNGTCMAWDNGDYLYTLFGASYNDGEQGYYRHYFYRYSISNDNWEQLENTLNPTGQGAGDAITWIPGSVLGTETDWIYAMVGNSGQTGQGTIFCRYNIDNDSWETVAYNPSWSGEGSDDGSSLVWAGGNHLYSLQGEWNESSPCYDFARYDLLNDNWADMAPIPAYPWGGGLGGVGDGGSLLWIGGEYGDFIYALSGNQCKPEPIYDNRFYLYTISTNTWQRLADMPGGVGDQNGHRLGFASGSMGKIYCWRGCSGDPVLWAYLPTEVEPPENVEVRLDPTDDTHITEAYPDTPAKAENGDPGIRYNMYVGYESTPYENTPVGGAMRTYLRFNLGEIPDDSTIKNAVLRLYNEYRPSDQYPDYNDRDLWLRTHKVDNDDWTEESLTWNIAEAHHPCGENITPVLHLTSENVWVEWDVTSYIQEQVTGDKIASICMKNLVEADDNSVWFYSKDVWPSEYAYRPYLKITYTPLESYAVRVSIDPEYRSGSPENMLDYTVTITNTGIENDNYVLTVVDDENWGLLLPDNLLEIPAGENENVTLSVTIPKDAEYCTEDLITITATSKTDNGISAENTCIAHQGYYKKENMPDLGQHCENWCWVAAAANSIWWWANHGYPQLIDNLEDNTSDNEWIDQWYSCPGCDNGYRKLLAVIASHCLGLPPEETWCHSVNDNQYFYGLREFIDDQGAPLVVHEIVDPTHFPPEDIPPPSENVVYDNVHFDNYKEQLLRCQDVLIWLDLDGEPSDHVVTGVGFFDDPVNPWIKVSDPWSTGAPDHNNDNENTEYDLCPVINRVPFRIFVPSWGENATVVKMIYISPEALGAEVNLIAGWNLVGFTAVGDNDTPNNIFTGLNYYTDYYLFWYLAPGGPYQLQGPDEVLKDNLGYWVWINRDNTVTTSGTPPLSRDIYLENGWNLVSFPVVNGSTTPNNIFTGLNYYTDYYLFWYLAPGGPYQLQGPDEVLKDNLGYWVWINRDNMVTVP